MPEKLLKFWKPIGIALLGLFSVLGGNVVTNLLGKIWPNGANWINENPFAYILIWGLVVYIGFLHKLNHDRGVELKGLRGHEPDLPLGEAINHIQKMRNWKEVNEVDILETIRRLAHSKKVVASGIIGEGLVGGLPISDSLMEIPHQFFYVINGGPTESDGYQLDLLNVEPGWHEWQEFKHFYHVMVNRDQIDAIFSRIKPIKLEK